METSSKKLQKELNLSNLKYFYQIDLIKALAIILVVISHSLPHYGVLYAWRVFILLWAVPLFFIVMGRNAGASFKKKGYKTLKEVYSKDYFQKKFSRIVLPVIVTFIVVAIIFILLKIPITIGTLTFGAGNYFIAILLEFIILFPILYVIYDHNPNFAIIISFCISFLFEVIIAKTNIIFRFPYFYEANILRYLFTIMLGLFILDNFDPNNVKAFLKNKIVVFGSIFSIMYLVAFSVFHFQFPYFSDYLAGSIPYWGGQNCLSAFYPLIIYAVLFKLFSLFSINKFTNFMGRIGKASYHIYLIQMLFFGFLGITGIFNLLNYLHFMNLTYETFYSLSLIAITAILACNLVVTITTGLLFYFIELKLKKRINLVHQRILHNIN